MGTFCVGEGHTDGFGRRVGLRCGEAGKELRVGGSEFSPGGKVIGALGLRMRTDLGQQIMEV